MAVLKAKIAALEGGAPVPGQTLTTSTFAPTYGMSSPTSIIESVPDYDAVAVVRNTSGSTNLAPGGAIDQRAVLEHELNTERRRALDLEGRIQARNQRLANELQTLKRKNAQLEVDYAASATRARPAAKTPGYETAADHDMAMAEEPIYAAAVDDGRRTPSPAFDTKVKSAKKEKAQQSAKTKADRMNAALKAKRDSEATLQATADKEAMMRDRRARREEKETAKLLRDAEGRTSAQQRKNREAPNKHSTGMQPQKDFRFVLTTPLRSTNSKHAHNKQEIYGVARHARDPRQPSHLQSKTKHVMGMVLHGHGADSSTDVDVPAEAPTVEEEEF